ncbi:MAG TPA: enoyl-CoA hydratase-related protein [Egibacteraceae bacterium]|nr:enoyl-CoA hydratase-related protein [Egibacteraceae bacterium]
MSAPLRLERDGGVAELVLDRPEAANSIDLGMARALLDAAIRLGQEPAVRVVLLRGEGARFCGGGDLKAFATTGDGLAGHLEEVTANLHAAIARLARLDAPVIAAVHGAAAGAGFSLACAADLLLAAEDTLFVPAYAKAGLSPDGSLSATLPRLVGPRRALELLLTGRPLSAREALDWGIVTAVHPDGELLDAARELAARLAEGPTRAYGAAKRLVRSGWELPLEAQMERESAELAAMARGRDGREGVAAFTERRPAVFTGE